MISRNSALSLVLFIFLLSMGALLLLVSRTLLHPAPVTQAQAVDAETAYAYDIIATLDAGDTSFEYVSINSGTAFSDTSTVVWNEHRPDVADRIFASDGTGAATEVDTSFPGGEFDGVQINNQGQIIAMDTDKFVSTTDFWRILRFDLDPDTDREIIARSTPDQDVTADFNLIFDNPSINNEGEIVFLASGGRDNRSDCGPNDNCMVVPNPATGDVNPFIEIALNAVNIPEPRIADNGLIVLRDGGLNNDLAIRIYNEDLSESESIATSAVYFDVLGARPGISDDGSVVVFYGDLTPAGAARYDTTAGPGIFASIAVGTDDLGNPQAGIRQPNPDIDAPRIIKRVAGTGGSLSAFEPDDPISVNDLRKVAYIAYSDTAQKGLYTSQLNFFSANFTTGRAITDTQTTIAPPALVAGQGVDIDGLGQIQDVAIHDALNNKGEVAFWASTGTQEAVIRARWDCPGSDYSAPLTSTYINQYDAGTEHDLPRRHGSRGGNACGPSSFVMAVNALNYTRGITERLDIQDVFDKTMQIGLDVGAEEPQSFHFFKGRTYVRRVLSTTLTAQIIRGKTQLDNALDQGYPVVASTSYTSRAWGNYSSGHVIVFWGRTAAGDYIVSDPAGNHWESETDHYGAEKCGAYKLYHQEDIEPYLEYRNGTDRWALLLCPPGGCPAVATLAQHQAAPPADAAVSSTALDGEAVLFAGWPGDDGPRQFFMWLEDAEGRRTGYLPDGSTVTDIPGSEATIGPVTVSAPESPADQERPPETWPYTLVVENLDEVQVFVAGIEDTDVDITMISYNTADGGIARQDTTTAVQQGATVEIDFPASPGANATPTPTTPSTQPTTEPGQTDVNIYLPLAIRQDQSAAQPTPTPTPTPTIPSGEPPTSTPTPSVTPTSTPPPTPSGPTPEPIGQGSSVAVEAVYGLGAINALAIAPDGETVLVGGSTGQAALLDPLTEDVIQRYSGHTAAVNAVAFSPDGQFVITGSSDATARLWERDTGRLLRLFSGHNSAVNAVAVSPDGSQILTGATTGSTSITDYVRLWDTETGETIRILEGHTGAVLAVAFSPDGTLALTGSQDRVAKLWDVATGEELRTLSGHGFTVTSVTFSPDGTQALTGGNTTARLWDVNTGGSRTIDAHAYRVDAVAFAPDGTRLLTGGTEDNRTGSVKLWDTEGNLLHTFGAHPRPVLTVAFSPDSEQALTGSDDGSIRLWDARVPDVQSIAHPDESAVEVVTFTPDGAQLLTGDAAGIARLWNAATGEVVQSFNGHTRAIEAVDLTPDGNYALTAATTDVTARIWDVATGAEVGTLEHPTNKFVYDAEFSAAGDQILTGNQGGSAYLWDWDSATLTRTLVHTLTHESTSTITGVAISPDGSQLATVSARQVFLWDAATGEVIRAFGDENGRFLNAVAFSPDGAWLAAVDQNFAVRLWQIDTGASRFLEKLSRASAPASVAFSPDGSRLVVDGSLEAYIWDVASGSLINVLAEHEAEINQATFSPDSSQVATASDDGTARIWDATAGSALSATPGGHTDSVEDIDFYSDGQTLVSGSWDGTLKLWDTASGTVRQTLRTAATGSGNAAISVVDVSADDRFIAAVEWNTLLLWDAQSGLLLRSFVPGTYDQLYTVALSPDGALLAAGGTGRTIYLFDTATGEEVRRFTQHSSLINDVMFSPDGSRLISGSDDGAALLWDVNDENVTLASFGRGEPIEAVAFSSDGERVATGDTQGVIVWDVNTAQEVNRLGEEILSSTPNIAAVAFASDGNYLLTARTSVAELWDIASGKLLRAYTGHTSRTAGNAAYINALAVAPDGTRFATSGARGNNNVRLWEVEVRPAVRSFADPDDAGYTSVAVSSDGQTVVTGNCDATAYLWDATTGAQLLSIPNFPGRTGPGGGPCVAYLDLSPDDTTLLAGTSTTLRLHDVQTGEALRTFTPHRWATFAAQFSADGEQIVTAGSDPRPRGCLEECGEAKLWDTASGELQATFIHDSQVSAAALSPDGRYLATADSFTGQAWLWDATNPTAPIVELRGGSSVIDSIAFSPDSSRILAGTRGGTAVMWDSATGGFLYSFNHGVYNQRVRHVAFANTQPWLVTTSEQTAYVWHSETGELLFAASAAWTMEDAVFTPDDRYLLTGNASGAATFWETADE